MPEPEDPAARLEARALALLARREYTRAELARRLARILSERPRAAASRAATALADEFAPPPRRPVPGGTRHSAGRDAAGVDPEDAIDPAGDHPPDGPDDSEPSARRALITGVLDRLEARRLLSDRRAAEAIVHVRRDQRGLLRIAHELEQKGVAPELASEVLGDLRETQVPLAREVWRKRFGVLPSNAGERARQSRFLATRGFSFEVIRAVLSGDGSE